MAPSIGLDFHPQAVERDKMHQRDDEGGDDRQRQDLVGNGDVGKCHDRHPDQIEDRNHHAEALCAQPVQPAEREFAALIG
jgi:hypothetical protein